MQKLIERRESGPAWMDKTSDLYAPDVEAEQEAAARQELARELGAVIAKGDANGLCGFALTDDAEKAKAMGMKWSDPGRPRRAQTLAEVLFDATDYSGGPSITEVFQLLLNACASSDTDLALQARALRDRLAAKWVEVQL